MLTTLGPLQLAVSWIEEFRFSFHLLLNLNLCIFIKSVTSTRSERQCLCKSSSAGGQLHLFFFLFFKTNQCDLCMLVGCRVHENRMTLLSLILKELCIKWLQRQSYNKNLFTGTKKVWVAFALFSTPLAVQCIVREKAPSVLEPHKRKHAFTNNKIH